MRQFFTHIAHTLKEAASDLFGNQHRGERCLGRHKSKKFRLEQAQKSQHRKETTGSVPQSSTVRA